ncbi:S-adenosylmethionine:tRNA ribosyltransferase-isomerase, partial [Candidatus Woesebacteria bacterium]|nr:S-adenosylmethionine:tRNA ribosyltransferase-isomerase [Candidatus Woesebacteria bacterium]
MLNITDFTYHLPGHAIAHSPTRERDHSRLLILDRRDGSISHTRFFDLPNLLDTSTVIVRNNTKVIKARLFGYKPSGGKVEILLNKKLAIADKTAAPFEYWECLTKPGLKPGTSVKFTGTDLTAECIPETPDNSTPPGYTRILRFSQTGNVFLQTLDHIGHTPLPPYIKNDDLDKTIARAYQTTFARVPGSVAAPTAGLHLTTELENTLKNKGIQILDLTLHVGLGTFLPVKINDISKHYMHSEWYELSEQTATELNRAKAHGKKILGIGTTS